MEKSSSRIALLVILWWLMADAKGDVTADAVIRDRWDWAEGTAANAGGADREFYNAAAGLRWRKLHGDWRDRFGVLHGSQPYGQLSIAIGTEDLPVRIDVTTLVQQWLNQRFANRGFFLRMSPESDGVLRFASRENPDPSLQPKLRLQFSDGEQLLAASADTDLDPSMAQSRGQNGNLKLSVGQHHGLLQFDLAALLERAQRLQKAELLLTALGRTGSALTVQIFAADTPQPLRQPAMPGLADSYAGDIGIRQHPQVIFATRFDEPHWQAAWAQLPLRHSVVNQAAQFEPLQQNALQVGLGKPTPQSTGVLPLIPWLGKAPEQIYVRYYLRLPDSAGVRTGSLRLPGVVAVEQDPAADISDVAATEPATAVPLWRGYALLLPAIGAGNPLAGRAPVVAVIHDLQDNEQPVRTLPWVLGDGAFLQRDRWYCIEQYVRLNTPGKADGVWQIWLDGQEVLNQRQLQLRRWHSERIGSFQLDLHDIDAPGREQLIYLDNLVLARRYIGPMPSAAAKSAAPLDEAPAAR
jgi:hypothetical protein